MDVFKDLHFISATIDVKSILIPDKGVISPCLRNDTGCRIALSYLIPLLLLNFVLKQVIEVSSPFACIPTKEVEAIPVRDGSRARPSLWLTINKLYSLVHLICLFIHRYISFVPLAPLGQILLDLIHLIVDVAVTCGLEDLVPLLRLGIELIHVVGATVGVGTRE
jgi:hypothetical protein